ncbi:hypothetical protein [Vibrio splendidus]|uniref:hypothetical protein n=1 Tax=Vibrio splendidus TaxID=29497 RepID=UPI000C82FC3F|nr:hypothetical protein [Vibrio splendidus]PMK14068.1 hypothetical protein BCU08_03065 [Vibrio splendidus]
MSNNFSFTKSSAIEHFQKVKDSVTAFKESPLDTNIADGVAQLLWSCTDYFHREKLCGCDHVQLRNCQAEIRKQCKSFSAINDVCDSAKHNGIDRPKVNLKQSYSKGGDFARGDFCFQDYNTPALIVEYTDGEKVDFETIVNESFDYLQSKLT